MCTDCIYTTDSSSTMVCFKRGELLDEVPQDISATMCSSDQANAITTEKDGSQTYNSINPSLNIASSTTPLPGQISGFEELELHYWQ